MFYYFLKWQRDGTLETLNWGLNMIFRAESGKNDTPSLVCADNQSIKAAPFISLDKGIDGNKKVNGRKRQALVDTMGNVWSALLNFQTCSYRSTRYY